MDTISSNLPGPTNASGTDIPMVFLRDKDSEGVMRQCLSDLSVAKAEFGTDGIDGAIAALKSRSSPRLLVVDVQGVDDPVARIRDLANVCDPETGVIAVGDLNDIGVYRALKATGVVEYFFKPLVRNLMMQACNAVLTGNTDQAPARSGNLTFVISVRGGAGGTTISSMAAWHLAESYKRRVALIDLDLQYGDAALQLDVAPSHALREALDHPERIDELFLERGVIRVGERLGLMAGLEPLDSSSGLNEQSLMSLLEHMLRRYRYLFIDIPAVAAAQVLSVLHLPGTIVLVSNATLSCARDVARWRDKIGPNSAERTTLHILNKSGATAGLPPEEFARAAGAKPDIIVPYAKEIGTASRLGVRGLQKCAVLQTALAPLFRQLAGEQPAKPSKSLLRGLLG